MRASYRSASLLCVCGLLVAVSFGARAETPPPVIRIGAPAVTGTEQGIFGVTGVARARQALEEEFKAEGVRFEFPGFKGGGPAVGQALANGQIDFAGNGDLISIIGKSSGIQSKLILPSGKLENAYLLVPPNSPIKSVQDLHGKRVAFFKGNYIHLQVLRILAANNMAEKDIKAINLGYATAAAALVAGDIDALFGGSETLNLRDRGAAKIIYTTHGQPARQTAQAGILVREAFANQYPETTARYVKAMVKTAYWASQEANRDAVYKIWAKGHRTYPQLKEDYGDRPLSDRLSPLLDPFFVAQYKDTQELAGKLGLLRGPAFSIDQWFDARYLDAALKELKLEHYWVPLDVNGKRIW